MKPSNRPRSNHPPRAATALLRLIAAADMPCGMGFANTTRLSG